MSLPYDNTLIPHARRLRKQATPQENHLWYDFLRHYPVRFQRQKSIGKYIVDFYCHKAKIAIEIDGSQHYESSGQEYDEKRTKELEQSGILVLRYSNRDINVSFQSVCEHIDITVKSRTGVQWD